MTEVLLSEVLTDAVHSAERQQADGAFVQAISEVGVLVLGWFPNARFGREEITTWSYLLSGLDPELFVPALVAYVQDHTDWPPTAPQLRKSVEALARRRTNEIIRARTELMLAATEAQLLSGS